MKITEIEVTRHIVPCDPPYPAAWDSIPRATLPMTIVRVRSNTGLEGFASGDPCYGIEDYRKYFIGQDPREMDRHTTVIENIGVHHSRMWPLDLALWDLNGKIEGQPVWKLLGGTSTDVPLYASTGSLRPAEVLADMGRGYRAQGYQAVKLRFGRTSEDSDIAALAAVREAVGDDAELYQRGLEVSGKFAKLMATKQDVFLGLLSYKPKQNPAGGLPDLGSLVGSLSDANGTGGAGGLNQLAGALAQGQMGNMLDPGKFAAEFMKKHKVEKWKFSAIYEVLDVHIKNPKLGKTQILNCNKILDEMKIDTSSTEKVANILNKSLN